MSVSSSVASPSSAASPLLVDRLIPAASRHLVGHIALVLADAASIGVFAQLSIPLWPVPVTGQTLAVMVVGALLGSRRAAAATTTYLVLGVAGVPWFAEFTGGVAALGKPSFGFIIGFIPAAFVIGWLSERQWDRAKWRVFAAFGIASIIPFLVGVPYMWLFLHFVTGTTLSFAATMAAGVTPFIIGGILKWVAGSLIIRGAWGLQSD